jgi:hypothetical protein
MILEHTASYGGDGGSEFIDDLTDFSRLRKIVIRHGSWIDAIQGIWSVEGVEISGPQHGGNGGGPSTIQLQEDELIVAIKGRAGTYVDSLTFVTNHGRTFGPYGGNGGNPFPDITAPEGILGFYGRAGSYLDKVGFVLAKR